MKKNTLIALALVSVIICVVSVSLLLTPKGQDDEKVNDENFELKPPIATEIPKDDVEDTTQVTTTETDATSETVTSSTQKEEKPKPTVTTPIVDSSESSQVTKLRPALEEKETTASLVGEESFVMTDEIIVGDKKVDVILPDPPQYIEPEINNDNPFDDGNKTEIIDVPVDDYIPDNGDRPGEGIHF